MITFTIILLILSLCIFLLNLDSFYDCRCLSHQTYYSRLSKRPLKIVLYSNSTTFIDCFYSIHYQVPIIHTWKPVLECIGHESYRIIRFDSKEEVEKELQKIKNTHNVKYKVIDINNVSKSS